MNIARETGDWAAWRRHFERSKERPLPLDAAKLAGCAGSLEPRRAQALASSLARMQLGETGEGRIARRIYGYDARLAGGAHHVDDDYRRALGLFIAEEGRHARILGELVRALGGRTLQHHVTHRIFSSVRQLGGVRGKLLVLLAAEVAAAVYYRLVAGALPEGPLKHALVEIADDEDQHLRFHCDFFRPLLRDGASRAIFLALFASAGAAAVTGVLVDHGGELAALGVSRRRALAAYRSRLRRTSQLVLAKQAVGPRRESVDSAATSVIREVRMSVATAALPRHVAIIMDGNGRWAAHRGLHRLEGHRRGADSVREVVRASREIGLSALTLYAFSSQNWDRPPDEVRALMGLLRDYLIEERTEILDNDIRLTTIGDESRLPAFVREPLDALRAESQDNGGMNLCLALSYGGRESICAAARDIAAQVQQGAIRLQDVNLLSFGEALSTRHLPELDLVIRTSGEQRMSNFLLWEAAYAELYFTDTLWPDFRRADLEEALATFGGRERRFGLTSEQVRLRATQ